MVSPPYSSTILGPLASAAEIKRHLLLGRKVMTNLDNILKSSDITLATKVRLVKAMVFPTAPSCGAPRIPSEEHLPGTILGHGVPDGFRVLTPDT